MTATAQTIPRRHLCPDLPAFRRPGFETGATWKPALNAFDMAFDGRLAAGHK